MTDHHTDFPFEEIRSPQGNYFQSVNEAKSYGHAEDQIWSVVVSENTWTYGPSHHFINVEGFIATVERHDGETYYHETLDIENCPDCDALEFSQPLSCQTCLAHQNT